MPGAQNNCESREDGFTKLTMGNDVNMPQGEVTDSEQDKPAEDSSSNLFFSQKEGGSETRQDIMRKHLLEAVRRDGNEAKSVEDAWRKIIAVQVEIALDPSKGSKATTAAKFLAQVAGVGYPEKEPSKETPMEMGSEAVKQLLQLVSEERKLRVEEP